MDILMQAAGSDLKPEYREYTGSAKLAPLAKYAFSREKAKRLLGWEPKVSIEEGIGRVLHWVDQQRAQVS